MGIEELFDSPHAEISAPVMHLGMSQDATPQGTETPTSPHSGGDGVVGPDGPARTTAPVEPTRSAGSETSHETARADDTAVAPATHRMSPVAYGANDVHTRHPGWDPVTGEPRSLYPELEMGAPYFLSVNEMMRHRTILTVLCFAQCLTLILLLFLLYHRR